MVHNEDELAHLYDVIVIGGGVSGFGAAMYSGRFQLKTLVIGEKVGGTIMLTNDVANYPGFEQIEGFELAEKIKNHALQYNVDLYPAKVSEITDCAEGCFKVHVNDKHFHARALIFATGTEWRKLGVKGEAEFTGKGVHYCALCDGAFYRDKIVAVIGGSDSAAKEALLLTEYAKKVYIIYRKDNIRPEPITLKRVTENKKIQIIPGTNVVSIEGDKFVNSIKLDKAFKGSKDFRVDGLFIEIGHVANSDLALSQGVKLNKKGEIIIDRDCNTNVQGIYAAGDVADNRFKQAITGVAEGVTAAYSAYHYLNEHNPICILDDNEEP